jgi:hypothetical protein
MWQNNKGKKKRNNKKEDEEDERTHASIISLRISISFSFFNADPFYSFFPLLFLQICIAFLVE